MTTAVTVQKAPDADDDVSLKEALEGIRRSDETFPERLLRVLSGQPKTGRRAGSPAVWVGRPMRRRPPQATNTGNGGAMPTAVVKSGQGRPPSQVTIIQNFGPGQNPSAPTQEGSVYSSAQFAAAVVAVRDVFSGNVPSWRALQIELTANGTQVTAAQAKALEEALVDNMPKKVAPPLAVVEAVEAEEEESESALRFFWGENGPTILSLILAFTFVAVVLFGAFMLFKNKTAKAVPVEQPPPALQTPASDSGGVVTTVYTCTFVYDGWQGGADVMLAEATTAFYGLPADKVGLVWSLVKDKPAGPNYPAGSTVSDAWNVNAGIGVVIELNQDEITNLGGSCSGTWKAREVEK